MRNSTKTSALTTLITAFALVLLVSATAFAQEASGPAPNGIGHTALLSDDTLGSAASTTDPKKADDAKPSAAPAKNGEKDTSSSVSRDADNANSVVVTGAPIATTKTATLAETPAKVASFVPRSPQAADDDKWHFQFSPYFWLASLHGTGGVGNRTTEVDESFSDIFHSLKFALMGVVEARKGKFVLLVDTEYVSIEDDRATPGPFFSDVTAKFKTFIFDPEVGYRVFAKPEKGQSIDVVGGIRVWHVSTELNFGAGILPAVTLDGSRNWVDAIVGLRGRTALSEKVFLSGKFDLGGGGSKFTWQFFGGLGYNIKPNIALIGGYRVLDVNYNKDNFVYDMNQRGPIMGLGFKF